MIEATLNGQDVFLLNDPPNFRREYQTDFDSSTDLQRSLTARETRRSYASTLVTTVRSTITVSGANLRTLEGVLRSVKAQPVLAPFWPAVSFWSDRASMLVSGGLYVAFKHDWSQYSIYEAGSEPGWPLAADLVAPLMHGFLKPQADFSPRSMDFASVVVEFTESSKASYALTFSTQVATDGPTPAGYPKPVPMLRYRPNYKNISESVSVEVSQKSIGFNRQRVKTFYPHDVYRSHKATYTLKSHADAIGLIAWYQSDGSDGKTFWTPSSIAAGRLAVASLAADVALTWKDAQVQIGDYICTYLSDGSIATAKVQNVVGDVVTVVTAFGVAFAIGQPFYLLALARLMPGKLSMLWRSPRLASSQLQWSEVRPEMLLPGNETLGTTIGALSERCILFHFWRDYGNGTTDHWYFTSYEDDILYEGNLYKSGPFAVGDIATSLNLEDDSCEITTSLTDEYGNLFSANPIIKDIALTAEAPLNVQVLYADVFQLGNDPVVDVGGDPIKDVGGDTIEGV